MQEKRAEGKSGAEAQKEAIGKSLGMAREKGLEVPKS